MSPSFIFSLRSAGHRAVTGEKENKLTGQIATLKPTAVLTAG